MTCLLRLLPGLMLCLLLFACDYSPSGEHYQEVNPNPPVTAEINLENYQDTIFARGSSYLHFNISLPGRSFFGFKLTLNNNLLMEGPHEKNSYFFNSGNYKDGYYVLQLRAAGNAKTGSLADKSGAEVLEVYRTWIVCIDNAPLQPVAVKKTTPVNGQLQVEWQLPKRPNYRKLILSKSDKYTTGVVASFDPGDPTSYWTDDAYVGGPVTYRITLLDWNDHKYIDGPEWTSDYPTPRIVQQTYNEANDLTLAFSATPFYRNFSSYQLTSPQGLEFSSSVSTDTVVTFRNLLFGQDYEVNLLTVLKKFENRYSNSGITSQSYIRGFGTPWGPHTPEALVPCPANGVFYEFGTSSISVIDDATLQVKQSRNLSASQPVVAYRPRHVVSEDGRYVYALLNNLIHQLHPVTLQTLATYKIEDLLPGSHYADLSLHGISNNNRLAIAARGLQQTDSLFLVDVGEKKVLQKRWLSVFQREAALSADGKALKPTDKLFVQQENGTWQHHTLAEGDFLFLSLKFHPTQPLYGIKQGRELRFYDTRTGERLKTLTTEATLATYFIDAASGYLYGYAGTTLYVYDLNTLQLKRKLQVTEQGSAFVYKDKIFAKDRYIPL